MPSGLRCGSQGREFLRTGDVKAAFMGIFLPFPINYRFSGRSEHRPLVLGSLHPGNSLNLIQCSKINVPHHQTPMVLSL